MPQKVKIKAILKRARTIQAVWDANPDFKMADTQLDDFNAIYNEAEGLVSEHRTKTVELSGIRIKRDIKVKQLNALVTRFRSGMRGHYGLDSIQYLQSGGVRASARKTPKRKAKIASA